jgi:hypothetical protein
VWVPEADGCQEAELLHSHTHTQGLDEFDQSTAIACLQKLHIGVHFVFTLELQNNVRGSKSVMGRKQIWNDLLNVLGI